MVPTVDHYRKLHHSRTTKVHKRVERRSSCPPCIEDVVHQNDDSSVNINRQLCRSNQRLRATNEIIAVEANIERSDRNADVFERSDSPSNAIRYWDTSPLKADEQKIPCAAIALDDLMGNPADDAPHIFGRKNLPLIRQKNLSPRWQRGSSREATRPWVRVLGRTPCQTHRTGFKG